MDESRGQPGQAKEVAAERWMRAKALFARVVSVPEEQVSAVLESESAGDARLRADVEAMLAADRTKLLEEVSQAVGLPPTGNDGNDRELPERIGRFAVRARLGSGATGEVYRALDSASGSEVAVKVLRRHLLETSAHRRLMQEMRTLTHLEHAALVRVVEVGEHEGRPFFASELVNGQPITQYATTTSRRSVLESFAQACDAVHYLHLKQVVHRDLKPGHILIDEDGRPHILDFGLAKVLSAESNGSSCTTHNGAILGTLEYMSPEQACAGEVDGRSDVFALGAVMHEILGGRPPRQVGTRLLHEVAVLVSREPLSSLRLANPLIEADLVAIVQKATGMNAPDRYSSASELAADIRRFLRHEPVAAKRHTLWSETRSLARRHPGSAGTIAVLSVLLCIVTVMAVISSRRAAANYEAARSTARALLGPSMRHLTDSAGTDGLRTSIVDQVRPGVEALARSSPQDIEIQIGYAQLLSADSDLAYKAGDWDRCLHLREHCEQVLRHALEIAMSQSRSKDVERLRSALSIVIVKTGDVQRQRGRLDLTRECYRQAMEIDAELSASSPSNTDIADQLFWSHHRLQGMDVVGGSPDQVISPRRALLSRALMLKAIDPERTKSEYAVTTAEYALAAALAEDEEQIEALEHFKKAIEAGERFLRSDWANQDVRALLVEVRSAAAMLELERPEVDFESARRLVDRSREGLDMLTQAEPDSARTFEIGHEYARAAAELALRQGDRATATAVWTNYIELCRTGLARHDGDEIRFRLAVGLRFRALAEGADSSQSTQDTGEAARLFESLLSSPTWGALASTRLAILLGDDRFPATYAPNRAVEIFCALKERHPNALTPREAMAFAKALSAAGRAEEASELVRQLLNNTPARRSTLRQVAIETAEYVRARRPK